MSALARVPPHDLDAESAVLSAILLLESSAAALAQVADILTPEDFYAPANRRIYEAIVALAEVGSPIDAVTVAAWLKSRERLVEVGGVPYIARVTDAAPFVTNLADYALIVRNKARVRALITTCQKIAAEGYGDVGNEQVFLEQAEEQVAALAQAGALRAETEEQLGETLMRLFRNARAGVPMMGVRIPLGLPALDAKLEVGPGDLVIVAGRPGMGKSACAMGCGVQVAKMAFRPWPEHGEPEDIYCQATRDEIFAVAMFSAEMPREQVGLRAVCAESKAATVSQLRTGAELSDEAWRKLTEATGALRGLPIWVDDMASPKLSYIRSKIRELKARLRRDWAPTEEDPRPTVLRLVVIDYLQIMGVDRRGAGKDRNREQELSEITRGLKALAKSEEVVIVLLSQLNRGVESRPNKRPTLGDLRESGAIEQDADAVVMVYRHGYYEKAYPHQHAVELLVEKQRNGATGRALAAFRGPFTLFEQLTESEERQLAEEDAAETSPAPRRRKGKLW